MTRAQPPCGAREVRCPCAWRGGACHCSRVMVGESGLKKSWQGCFLLKAVGEPPCSAFFPQPLGVRWPSLVSLGIWPSSPGDLADPGIKPMSPASPALAGGFFTTLPLGSPDTTPRDADLRGEAGPMHLRFQGTPGDVHSFSQHIFTMCWMFFYKGSPLVRPEGRDGP